MRKIIYFTAYFGLFLFLSFNRVFAVTLTHIGALNTNGVEYAEWWYSGTNPTLSGTADAGATVTVTIDGQQQTATADSSGNWSLATTLAQGDYDIEITSEGESYDFTLHVGQEFTGTTTTKGGLETTQSTVPVPDTGSHQTPFIIMSLGLGLLATYYIKYGRESAIKSFEKTVSK